MKAFKKGMLTIQVLSQDNDFHGSCLVITTEKYRFLVNVGEGTQRLVVEHRIKLGKMRSIFLTSGNIENVGGLPGMLLTLDDAGVSSPEVVCPDAALNYLKATQYFMRPVGSFTVIAKDTVSMALNFEELLMKPIVINVLVSGKEETRLCFIGESPAVPGKFDINRAKELKIPKGPLYGKLKNGSSIQLEDGTVINPDEVVGESTPAQYFAIICKVDDPSQISALLNTKDLTENLQSANLIVVYHLSPSRITSHPLYLQFLQLFQPSIKHIFVGCQCDSLITSSFISAAVYNSKLHHLFGKYFLNGLDHLQSHVSSSPVLASNHLIAESLLKFHLLPIKNSGVIDYLYSSLLTAAREELTSFLTETRNTYPYFSSLQQEKERLLRNHSSTSTDLNYRLFFFGTGCAIPSKFRNVSSFLIYLPHSESGILCDCGEATWYQMMHVSPPTIIDSSIAAIPLSDFAVHWSRIIKVVWISHPHADHHLGLVQLILQRKRILQQDFQPLVIVAPMVLYYYLQELHELYPELVAAYLFIPNNYFDPLETCVTCSDASNPTATVSLPIPITSDPAIIKTEEDANTSNTFPTATNTTTEEREAKRSKRSLPSYYEYYEQYLVPATTTTESPILQKMKQIFTQVGIHSIVNIPVIHCRQAYGLILTLSIPSISSSFSKNIKIVYSGDTRPCESLVYYGKDCDVLIHEATFEDDKQTEAIAKKHSTISEATMIGIAMNTKHLILTHFSQRYHGVPLQFHPKGANPVLLLQQRATETTTAFLNPIIAFDFLTCSYQDLGWLPYLTYPIAELFAKDALVVGEEND